MFKSNRYHNYYILEGKKPVPCDDIITWARWMEANSRTVKRDVISDEIYVSTVFLGINHGFMIGKPAVLFETMIFGIYDDNEYCEYCERYRTWEGAEAGHRKAVDIAIKYITERNKNKNGSCKT